jgi:N-acetyl-gamma-glutamyl-phosphate reductase
MGSNGLTVGVVGAAGYSGGELCRLLLNHPGVGAILPASRGELPFEQAHPNLAGCGLEFLSPELLVESAGGLDFVFYSAPAGTAMREAPRFVEAGVRVIDLSPDFRFADPVVYERIYGEPHASPHLLGEAAYGVTELYRDDVREARIVANPGCYVITGVLGLAPLVAGGLADLDRTIHISALNGTTGAGSTPRREVMHPEVFGSVLPYSMEGHRHGPELEDRIGALAGRKVCVGLSTAHGAFARGICLQASVSVRGRGDGAITRETLLDLYRDFHGPGHEGNYFVLLNELPKNGKPNAKEYDVYPSVASVAGSNFCHLGVDYDAERGIAKTIAVTDNLVKGAAGSAIQNMNVMAGIDETAGLTHYGL